MAPMESVEEEEREEPVRRVPRRPVLKTLSFMIREIREGKEKEEKKLIEEEDERLDDDLDLLREMEADMEMGGGKIGGDMDRDGFLEGGDEDEVEGGDDGKGEQKDGVFRRLWKKKGQKRTTKRVISMLFIVLKGLYLTVSVRPTRSKPTTSTVEETPEDDDDDEDNEERDDKNHDLDEPVETKKTNKKYVPEKPKANPTEEMAKADC